MALSITPLSIQCLTMADPNLKTQPEIMQQTIDPLAQLRDIHQPAMIGDWPPAPGWWLLAAMVLSALALLIVKTFLHWRANRYRREAIKELKMLFKDWQLNKDDIAYVTGLQQLLKRVALTSFPRTSVASLTGEAWVQFLDRSSRRHDFSIGEMELLSDGSYRSKINIDVRKMQLFAQQWVRKHDSRFLLREKR